MFRSRSRQEIQAFGPLQCFRGSFFVCSDGAGRERKMWNRHDSTSTKRAPANSLRSPQSKTNSLFWILDFLGNLGWLAPIVSPSASTRFPMPEAKSAYRRCFETLRSGTPTHARSAADAAFLESKMRMDPAMPRCRARFNAMTPGLMSLRPVLHDCSQNLCPAGNSRETTLDACRSLARARQNRLRRCWVPR